MGFIKIGNGPAPRHMSRMRFAQTAQGKILGVASTAVMAGLLLAPAPARAAGWISFDEGRGGYYEEAASGDGWSWDGAEDLQLNNYNAENSGGKIAYGDGPLTVTLTGDNYIESWHADGGAFNDYALGGDGDLTIAGDGSLAITSATDIEDASNIAGVYTDGNLVIDSASVSVGHQEGSGEIISGTGIRASGNAEIRNGANVSIDYSGIGDNFDRDAWEWGEPERFGMGISVGGNLAVVDSTLDVKASTSPVTANQITFANSTVRASSDDAGFWAGADATSIAIENEVGTTEIATVTSARDGLGRSAIMGAVVLDPGTEDPQDDPEPVTPDPVIEVPQEAEAEPQADVAQGSAAQPAKVVPTAQAETTSLPQTSDPTSLALIEMISAASGTLIGASAAIRRRKNH